ncbi:hypothetical protein BCL64_104270 [Halomonas ventosae]|uniref:Phage integrase family protein n=2 Tax=Halomonas ventosae TaxID=229007 RepID=A0A2T0VPU6_9GAMM|nr:hypothetical protein BCL64_104270 [Halomonas ventosae]
MLLRADQRPLIVSRTGEALTKSAWDTAWQRFSRAALEDGTITEDERFSLHDLKRKGITATRAPGTRNRKAAATVHRSPFTVHRSPFTVHRG